MLAAALDEEKVRLTSGDDSSDDRDRQNDDADAQNAEIHQTIKSTYERP